MKTVKGVMKRSVVSDRKLTKGDKVELPEVLARDLEKAGYFKPDHQTREDKTFNQRETRKRK